MAAATRGGGKVSLGGFVTMSENANAGGRNSGIRQNCSSEGNTATNSENESGTQAAQQCAGPGCDMGIERRARGRQRRFCSDLCQKRAYRNGISGQGKAGPFPTTGSVHLNARTALYSKTAHFRTNEIKGLQNSLARRSEGIIGPRKVIRAEVFAGRKWEQVVSSSGVVSYVSRISKRALVEGGAP